MRYKVHLSILWLHLCSLHGCNDAMLYQYDMVAWLLSNWLQVCTRGGMIPICRRYRVYIYVYPFFTVAYILPRPFTFNNLHIIVLVEWVMVVVKSGGGGWIGTRWLYLVVVIVDWWLWLLVVVGGGWRYGHRTMKMQNPPTPLWHVSRRWRGSWWI